VTLTFDGTGGLFTRIGQMSKACRMFNGSVNGSAPSNASAWAASGPTIVGYQTVIDAIEDNFEANLQSLISNLYPTLATFRQSGDSLKTYLKDLATQTLIEQVHADSPLLAKTTENALKQLIIQMVANSKTVKANTVSAAAATAAGTNVGNAVITASVVGADGKNMEYINPETLTFKVTNDSLNGGTAGSEPITVTGQANTARSPLDYVWPKGSALTGKSITMVDNSIDGAAGTTTGNLLTNSDLETFTVANTPDNFALTVGSFGTSILNGLSDARKGSACLEFVGDGAELTNIYQQFNNVSGTLSVLRPGRVYAFSAWVKVTATPAAGVIAFELTDGNNTLLSDDASTNNAITQSLPAVSTSYVNVKGFFRTKKTFTGTARLRIRLSTALSVGESVFIDDIAMCEAVQLYTGGPWVAAFEGTTAVMTNDYWTIVIANNMSAAGTAGGVLQTSFEQFFSMRSLGLQLPSATGGGETVADTLAF